MAIVQETFSVHFYKRRVGMSQKGELLFLEPHFLHGNTFSFKFPSQGGVPGREKGFWKMAFQVGILVTGEADSSICILYYHCYIYFKFSFNCSHFINHWKILFRLLDRKKYIKQSLPKSSVEGRNNLSICRTGVQQQCDPQDQAAARDRRGFFLTSL